MPSEIGPLDSAVRVAASPTVARPERLAPSPRGPAEAGSAEGVALSAAAQGHLGEGSAAALPTGRPAGQVSTDLAMRPAPADTASGGSWVESLPAPLRKLGDTFQRLGDKYNVDPRFLAAISMHETAHGTSYAYKHKNNAMGICGSGGTKRFRDVHDSIEASARALASPELYGKATTIREIGARYAPHGAANDPQGLNHSWVGGVTQNYRKLGGNPATPVIVR